jgi:hypothetical protein
MSIKVENENQDLSLAYPEVRLRRWYKAEYKQLIGNYFEHYNDDRPSREQLKAPHKQLLLELVFYAHIVIERDSKALASDGVSYEVTPQSWIRVNLNRFRLSRELHRSPDTVKRYKKRLAEAGAILSTQEDFDREGVHKGARNHVLINPDLLLIYDRFNPEYQPTSPYLSLTEILAIRKFKGANCIGVSSTAALQEQVNNEIRAGETVDKRRPAIAEQSTGAKELLPEHPPKLDVFKPEHQKSSAKKGTKIQENLPDSPVEAENWNKEVAPAPATSPENSEIREKRGKLAVLRRAFAVELYAILVHFLFRDHSVYQGEASNAISYIEHVYAANLTTEAEAEKWMKQYKWRAKKAADYYNRHGYDTSNIYPSHYVNVHNPKGFVATKAWWIKHQNDLRRKASQKQVNQQKLTEMQVYKACLDECIAYPSVSIVKVKLAEVQEKIPHLLQQFTDEVWPAVNGVKA